MASPPAPEFHAVLAGLARAALPLPLLLLAACSDSGSPGRPTGAADTVVLERVAAIGQIAGAEEYQFGHVGGVTRDDEGRVYVSDRLAHLIRVYGEDGAHLRQIGRRGEGPGEYESPTDLFFDDGGRLWVRDARRATALAPREAGAIPDSVAETRAFTGYTNWTSSARSRLIDGLYWYPGYLARRGEPTRYFYFAYGPEGVTGDTIEVPPYATLQSAAEAFYMTSPSGGRMVRGLNRAPFEPAPSWELTRRGTIIGGAGDSLVVETDSTGDTLGVFRLRPPRAVSDDEAADSSAALEARLDSLPVPLSEVRGVSGGVQSGELPDTLPGFLSVHNSTGGEVWVRRWPAAGQPPRTDFDVYSAEGALVRSVVLPERILSEPPPFIDDRTITAVVQDPETDVHRVVVYRIPAAPAS